MIKIFGTHDEKTKEQIETCASHGNVVAAALMADGHYGYNIPIGGVIAYKDQITPAGVGFDIGCGNKAVRTNISYNSAFRDALPKLMDAVADRIGFGVGRKDGLDADHEVFQDPRWEMPIIKDLKKSARKQLGTVGGGNHFVDLLVEVNEDGSYNEQSPIWVANHFGSRGFGWNAAARFMNIAAGADPLEGNVHRTKKMEEAPDILEVASESGQDYLQVMDLAGKYAYAGRDLVIDEVMDILGARSTFSVHNHHNFAWLENHFGEDLWVVRKGATPLFPNQFGFVGGSMCDVAVILEGKDSEEASSTLNSSVHGAGRVMGRNQAKGKWRWKRNPDTGEKELVQKSQGAVTQEMMRGAIEDYGIELRGGDLDESPFVYRKLKNVLSAYKDSFEVRHVLRPIGVAMAPSTVFDPYKD